MSVTLNLSADTEHRLREQANREGKSLENYLELLAERSAVANASGPPPGETSEQWIARLRAWAASHPPISHFVDDSRESIY